MYKILIIEDEMLLRETLIELLSYSGYKVVDAKNGSEGLQAVKKTVPDLIICDLMMPVMDGYGFMELHQQSDYSHIAVLILSAETDYIKQQRVLSLGAQKIIIKPFVFKELKNSIDAQLLLINKSNL